MSTNSWSYGQIPLVNPLDLNCQVSEPVLSGGTEQYYDQSQSNNFHSTFHVCGDAGSILHYSNVISNVSAIPDGVTSCFTVVSSTVDSQFQVNPTNVSISLAGLSPQGQPNIKVEFDIVIPNFVSISPSNLYFFKLVSNGSCTAQCEPTFLQLYINPTPNFELSYTKTSCNPDVYELKATQTAGAWDYGGTWLSGTTIHTSLNQFVATVNSPNTYGFIANNPYQLTPLCSFQDQIGIEDVSVTLLSAELTDCKKSTRTLTASAQSNCTNCTYTWVLSNGLNSTTYTTSVPNLSVNPPNFYNNNQNLTLSVSIGASNNCSSSLSVAITCCDEGIQKIGGICEFNISNYISQNGNILSSTNPVIFTGKIIIDKDFEIKGTNVLLNPSTEIIVLSGNTLTISNGSRLEACNMMWMGIAVAKKANLIISDSYIQDAILAVNSYGGFLDFKRNIFSQNANHVTVSTYQDISKPLHFTGNSFVCPKDLKKRLYAGNSCVSGGSVLPYPRTYRAINFYNCFDPNNSHQPVITFDRNIISHAKEGLYINGTDLNVLNSNFSSCHEYGVYAKASGAEPKNVYLLNCRFTGINSPYQMLKGVGYYATGGVKTDIVSSFFANINYLGVQVEKTTALNHSVVNSSFNKAGIQSIGFWEIAKSIVIIENDTIYGNSNQFYGALSIRNSIQQDAYARVRNNRIANVTYGMLLTGLGGAEVENNRITLSGFYPDANNRYAGIKLENFKGKLSSVTFNTVQLQNGKTPSWQEVGIEIADVPEVFVQDNLVKNVGRGLWFSGANTNNKVTCNEMVSPEIGWVIVNSDLADQGDPITPQENKWKYPNGYPAGINYNIYMDNYLAPSQQWKLYVRNGVTGLPYLPINNGGGFFLILPSSSIQSCTPGYVNPEKRRVVNKYLETQPSLTARSWNQTHTLYLDLLADTNLVEPNLVQYRDSLSNTSMSNFALIDQSIQAENWTQVQNIAQNISCTCASEHNFLKMIQWMADKKISMVDTLSSSDENFLDSLAQLNSIEKGKGIIAARVNHNKGMNRFRWYNDGNVNTSAAKMANTVEEKAVENEIFSVYPNPATKEITIQGVNVGEKITILNLQGQTVFLDTLTEKKVISFELQAGIYILKAGEQVTKITIVK